MPMAGPEAAVTLDDTRKREIKEIICEILKVRMDVVTETSSFVTDHGADSLQYIEVLEAIERTCGVRVDPAEMSRMVTLAGVYAVVEESL